MAGGRAEAAGSGPGHVCGWGEKATTGGTAEVSLRKLVNNADMDIPTCGSSLASLASVYK